MQSLELPVVIYRVGNACFSNARIETMIQRTNCKLAPASLRVKIDMIGWIRDITLAYVPQDAAAKDSHVRQLLEYGRGRPKRLRIFLIKKTWERDLDSWTYDPVENPDDEELLGGAILITEFFNDNSDAWYEYLGYQPTCDTLQHELGHVLMQEAQHVTGDEPNFFHDTPSMSDDTMTAEQIRMMRKSKYLRPA